MNLILRKIQAILKDGNYFLLPINKQPIKCAKVKTSKQEIFPIDEII